MSGGEDKEKKLTEMLKKVVSSGVTAAFMTEEAVRQAFSDVSLPKEFVAGLLQNAKHTKDEFMSSITKELKGYLSKVNVTEEIDKVLEKYDFEINATIKLNKKSGAKNREDSK